MTLGWYLQFFLQRRDGLGLCFVHVLLRPVLFSSLLNNFSLLFYVFFFPLLLKKEDLCGVISPPPYPSSAVAAFASAFVAAFVVSVVVVVVTFDVAVAAVVVAVFVFVLVAAAFPIVDAALSLLSLLQFSLFWPLLSLLWDILL